MRNSGRSIRETSRRGHLGVCIFSFVLIVAPKGYSATLLHQFDFNGNLADTKGTGVVLQVHPNTATSSFPADGWRWTATTNPGGGLTLNTDRLTDPRDYSPGCRMAFDQVPPGYRKILSFKGAADVARTLTVNALATPTPTPTPTPAITVTNPSGQAQVQNEVVQAAISGFDPNIPVTLATPDNDTATVTIGTTDRPALAILGLLGAAFLGMGLSRE